MMKRTLPALLLTVAMLFSLLTGFAEQETPSLDFRSIPGHTCFPLIADNPEMPGNFVLDAPMEWDGTDASEVYGIPTCMALRDYNHMVLICEFNLVDQVIIMNTPNHPLGGFLSEGQAICRTGKSTEESKILETFDIHGLKATRVEMVGQGFEMIWIDDGNLYFFMYPADPDDTDYTQTVAGMVDSFTLLHPSTVQDAPVEDFAYTVRDDGIVIDAYTGEAAYVHIPAQIDGKPVVAVGEQAFYETDVREVTFPDSVTELGAHLFGGCNELSSVTLPAGLKVLPEGTFESCFRLIDLELNEGLEVIENFAFWADNYLYTIKLPDSLRELGDANFVAMWTPYEFIVSENCEGFRTENDGGVLFSKDGKRLIRYTYKNRDASYTVPDGVESIDQNAFYEATDLEEVILPESLRTIGSLAFALSGVKEITIPAGVTEIGLSTGYVDENGNPLTGYTNIGNNMIIQGWPGTAAEEHAKKFNLTFIPVEDAGSEETAASVEE